VTVNKKAGGRTRESKSAEEIGLVKVTIKVAALGQGWFVVDMPLLYQIRCPGEKMD
jgi:hypothetical protein